MKTMVSRTSSIVFILTIMATTLMGGCIGIRMGERIVDKTAGMNGSFEFTDSGLPVNWLIYTPATIPTGDYDLVIDTTEYKDGKQSLKFLVRECSPNGSWHSPGLFQVYDVTPGEIYKVSFWVKNEGSEFHVMLLSDECREDQDDPDHTVVKSRESIHDWKLFEYDYEMPCEKIKFELNVLKPGSFWIDDIKIEGINIK